MPQIGLTNDTMTTGVSAGGYQYSGTKVTSLGASRYTITSVVVDVSGSVYGYKTQIEEMLENIRAACSDPDRCPNCLNLLHRVTYFNHGLSETHGFREVVTVQPGEYKGTVHPSGNTALTDATLEAIDSTVSYAQTLKNEEYISNAVIFVLTDGEENSSVKTTDAIAKLLAKVRKGEVLESIQVILLGLVPQGSNTSAELDKWKTEAGLDRYLCVGDLSGLDAKRIQGKLAKVADWVSASVSSTSKALGGGQASQPLPATF